MISVLFNEPKLLKYVGGAVGRHPGGNFSALQRAEIAEIDEALAIVPETLHFSALQRAEIAEIDEALAIVPETLHFSALQRAEIAEMPVGVSLGVCAPGFQCSSTSRNC